MNPVVSRVVTLLLLPTLLYRDGIGYPDPLPLYTPYSSLYKGVCAPEVRAREELTVKSYLWYPPISFICKGQLPLFTVELPY